MKNYFPSKEWTRKFKDLALFRMLEDFPGKKYKSKREFNQLLRFYCEGYRADFFSTILSRKLSGHQHVGAIRLVRPKKTPASARPAGA